MIFILIGIGIKNNPMTAVNKFLNKNKKFEIDPEINNKLMITMAKMAISEKNKTLTIGIPVHNGSKFIEKRIIEIQNAVKCDYRIIISDNFSDDKTQEICKNFYQIKTLLIIGKIEI